MPKTIEQAWNELHQRLTPTGSETQAAISHRASIEDCLRRHFSMSNYFRCGSFGNGTSVSGYSDVDYLACINPGYAIDSKSFLSLVQKMLAARFPNTGVRVNSPAVMVPFGAKAETTEVVPAIFANMVTWQGENIYQIADGNGGWMRTCPDAHNAYVRAADVRLGNRVKPLVRFLKAWKYYNNVPISSFFLEMYVATWANTQAYIDYSPDFNSLIHALSANLVAIGDPTGVTSHIFPCATTANVTETRNALARACTYAANARQCEAGGFIKDAFDWWNVAFCNTFSSYNN